MIQAAPVVRCTRCGGWITRRALHTEELPTIAFTCAFCGEDYEVLGGALVSLTRPATPTTLAEMRHESHALAVEAGTARRRWERGT